MTGHQLVLPAAILIILLGLVWIVWQIRNELETAQSVDRDQLSAAISESWRNMDLDETVVALRNDADRMQEFHRDITKMLRSPQERGEFGEQQLDVMLGDHLPPEMYGIRERVAGGKTPDAHIKSTAGIICIDSKFPLDNYERYLDAETEEERQRFQRQFSTDVSNQLEKIAQDYVRPSEGTTDFAFAFIPSESVYYHLITEQYDMLREFTKQGVQVVSPLTFGHKLELIKADVQAQKLSEQADEILGHLRQLDDSFSAVQNEWETLYQHISNAKNKADDVDQAYSRLRADFDRIEQPTIDE